MPFFQPKPIVDVNEKARIEFFLHMLADCLGAKRFQLPVLATAELLDLDAADRGANSLLDKLSQHLDHDCHAVEVSVVPQAIEKCGGGG